MTRKGVYFIPSINQIWIIENVKYYEDLIRKPFSIADCITEKGTYKKCLITKDQFKRFIRIGEL